jgi:hypothetical protein
MSLVNGRIACYTLACLTLVTVVEARGPGGGGGGKGTPNAGQRPAGLNHASGNFNAGGGGRPQPPAFNNSSIPKPPPGFDRRENQWDRQEQKFDKREDRADRAEDIWDAKHNTGPQDKREDYWDKREDFYDRAEDKRDRAEDVRDAQHQPPHDKSVSGNGNKKPPQRPLPPEVRQLIMQHMHQKKTAPTP